MLVLHCVSASTVWAKRSALNGVAAAPARTRAGPVIVPRIKAELAACLARDGFASVQDAVGADHRGGGKRKR